MGVGASKQGSPMTKEYVPVKEEQGINHLGSCYMPRDMLTLYTWHGALEVVPLLEGIHFTRKIKAQSK